MRKIFTFSLYALLSIGSYCVLSDFCHKQTKGFQVGKIVSHIPFEESLAVAISNEEEQEMLYSTTQPFTYLKKGKYCYVFVSQDQKYVLKFLQKEPITTSLWNFSKTISLEKETRKKLNFASYKTAFEQLKNQSATVYLHLNTTSHLNQKVTLFDAIGAKHTLSLDSTPFILQRKAEPFCSYFLKSSPEKRKELLRQFASSLKEKALAGVCDRDLSPRYNLGVLDGKVVCFDLDGLRPSSLETQEQMLLGAKKMILWLESANSDLALFLQDEIKNQMN